MAAKSAEHWADSMDAMWAAKTVVWMAVWRADKSVDCLAVSRAESSAALTEIQRAV